MVFSLQTEPMKSSIGNVVHVGQPDRKMLESSLTGEAKRTIQKHSSR